MVLGCKYFKRPIYCTKSQTVSRIWYVQAGDYVFRYDRFAKVWNYWGQWKIGLDRGTERACRLDLIADHIPLLKRKHIRGAVDTMVFDEYIDSL